MLVLVLALLPVAASLTAARTPVATPGTAAGHEDIVPSQVDAVRRATERDLARYAMDIAVDPGAGIIGGTMAITFVNRYGEPLDDVYLRLFPNGLHYGDGGTDVSDVRVNGEPVTTALSTEDTVLAVPLAEPLAPGAASMIELTFTTTVPVDSDGSYGILSRSSGDATWALADWHPILAGYEPAPGIGWRLDPPFDGIDPTFGDAALYDVTLDTGGLDLVSTGVEIADRTGDIVRIGAGPVRDFTLVLGEGWSVTTRSVGETTIRYATRVEDPAAIDAVLGVVVRALEGYGERFGAYPYRELDLADVPLTSGTLGISWASLIYLDGPSLAAQAGDRQFLDFLISHEVGHQWWAGLVGFNSNDHTFLAEGITNYLMTAEVEWSQGRPAAVDMIRTWVAPRYLTLLRAGGDAAPDVPYPEAPAGFGDLLYGKAALGFLAIRLEIGDDAFFGALARLASDDGFRFGIAEPADVLSAFEVMSGQELDALWSRWFEQAVTTPDDVEAVIVRYAAG
jgi:hypothetical protein